MLSLYMIIVVLIGHFVADFVCQTDKMAKGKSTSNYWLSTHVLAYMLVMSVPAIMIFGVHKPIALAWVIINGYFHWLTDFFSSRWSSRLWKEGKTHDFFVVIGLDQTIHYVTLFSTLLMMVKF